VFGVREAAWPSVRADLRLSYAAIGILLTVPTLVSGVVEPFFGLLGDSSRRRAIVAAGGATFAGALLLIAAAGNFSVLLIGLLVLYPASGAFVSLSQATLMDIDPQSHETNMARWVLAGSVGVVVGPIAFAAATYAGWGWRPVFVVLALATVPLVFRSWSATHFSGGASHRLRDSASTAWRALRNREVLRWLVLLHVTDLLGDVLAGFIALYFVDVVHAPVAAAALALVVWSVAGLVGDALLVPLLARVSGLGYLRVSALLATVVYPSLLVVPGAGAKLVLLAVLGMLHAGWYAIPQARLYSELQGNSGVALAVSNITGLAAGLFPLLIGLLAERFGLATALWCCLLAPIAVLLLLPPKEAGGRIHSARGNIGPG
jgi:MFS transporter, FSR family, fosmidomycin resistance protein